MLKFALAASLAAAAAWLPMAQPALAHDANTAYLYDNGLLVGNQDDEYDDADVVSVAEPSPVYVAPNDTIVTPYGYQPYNSNGYYQGYAYNPQYAYNPYYASAVYAPDPLSSAVVGTILNLAQGGRVDGRQLIGALVAGYAAQQLQQQYGQQGYPPQYYPAQYYPPQYDAQQYVPMQYAPVQYVPVRGERHEDEDRGDDDGGDD